MEKRDRADRPTRETDPGFWPALCKGRRNQMKQYSYFPGCTLKEKARELDL